MHPDILYAVQNAQTLASPPRLLARLIEVTADPNFSQEQVGRLLSSDPGVAAAILRLANSSVLGGVRKISTVREAVVRLGIRQVRTLVAAQCIVHSMKQSATPDIDLSYFWRRSVFTAIIASRCTEHIARPDRELAFTTGLLCDVGILLLCKAVPGMYRPIAAAYPLAAPGDLLAQEFQELGTTHAQVGAIALERWMLPPEIVVAIRHHHGCADRSIPPRITRLCGILAGAGEIARMLSQPAQPDVSVDGVLQAAIGSIGLSASILAGILPHVEREMDELASALHIEIIPGPAYRTIAQSFASHSALRPAA
ncbi:MAG: HDOD domain-containing protein [Phycisphaerales bacterium]|nr:HDOD domain-containing protein [Phycisphaerales bacterium]